MSDDALRFLPGAPPWSNSDLSLRTVGAETSYRTPEPATFSKMGGGGTFSGIPANRICYEIAEREIRSSSMPG